MPRAATATRKSAPAACRLILAGVPQVVIGTRQRALEAGDALLLAWLAIEGPTSRARLCALLFPGVNDATARNSLRQRLFKLRKKLDAEIVAGEAVLLLAANVAIELDGDGELLAGTDAGDLEEMSEWLDAQRDKRHSAHTGRLAAAAEQAEAAGELAAALEHASQLVQLQPDSEHAHRRVMRLHYLRGDRAAALAAYEACRRSLARLLNAAPSSETDALRDTVVRSSTAAAASPGALALRPLPVTLSRPPRLIGREQTLRMLERAWNDGRPFLLSGEAGIGKSRVLAEFVAAWRGAVVVASRPGDGAAPYAALARVLRAVGDPREAALDAAARETLSHLLPELAASNAIRARDDVVDSMTLQRHVEHLLLDATERGLGGLIVDDLHFADAASVEMLAALCESDRLARARFGFAQRPAEAAATPDVWRLLRSESRGPYDIIMAPLNEAEVGLLIDSLELNGLDGKRWASVLHRHTGGNPVFILETLKSLLVDGRPESTQGQLPLPVSIAGVIEARIKKLSAPALALARVAAVAGNDLSVDMASHILQQRIVDLADPWSELEAAHIFKGDAFAHDLIFEAMRTCVPQAIARRLHAEVAAWMEKHAGPVARIADHWWAAGQQRPAGRCWQQAAMQARQASRRAEEAEFLERGAAAFRATEDLAEEIDCLEPLVVALTYVDIGQRLDVAVERAVICAATAEQRLRVLLAAAYAEQGRSHYEQCLGYAREALRLSTDLQQPAAGFYAARTVATALTAVGSPQDALQIMEQHRGWVEVHGSAENRCEFASDRSWPLLALGRLAEARASFEQALAIATELDHAADMNAILNLLASTEARMGLCRAALAHSERAIRLHDRLGSSIATPTNDFITAAVVGARLGRYSEALHRLTEALFKFESAGADGYASSARYLLVLIYNELGQFARARQVAARELAMEPAKRPSRYFQIQAALTEAAESNPIDLYRQILMMLGETAGSTLLNTRDVAMLGCARWNSSTPTINNFDAIVLDAEKWEKNGILIAALALRAQADTRFDKAADDVRRALSLLEQFEPEGIYRAEVWAIAATVFAKAGAHDEAERAVHDGARWVETTARSHVPEEFRDSFLNRNRVNLELLRAASRQQRLSH